MAKIKIPNFFNRTRYRRLILVAIGTMVWCIIVLPVLDSYRKEGLKGGSHTEYESPELAYNPNLGFLDINIDLLSIDPASRKADFLVQIDPRGELKDDEGALTTNLTGNLRFKQVKLLKGARVEPFTLTVPFLLGTLRDYPFDNFTAAFPIHFSAANQNIRTQFSTTTLTPFRLGIDGVSQLFRIRFRVVAASDLYEGADPSTFGTHPQSQMVLITIMRPPTTMMVCGFMAALMWALAIAMVNIAFDSIVYQREIPPPLLGIGISMLFALPTLRNSQPGAPAMGCLVDMLGFFWSIVLIAFSSSALLFKWVLDWKPPVFQPETNATPA